MFTEILKATMEVRLRCRIVWMAITGGRLGQLGRCFKLGFVCSYNTWRLTFSLKMMNKCDLSIVLLKCRQREGEHPYRSYHQSEKRYRHGQRRSRSADSGNWPALEDYGVMDVPHQQRNLSGEIRPSNSSRREGKNYKHDDRDYRRSYEDDSRLGHEPSYGMPGHREDKYLEVIVTLGQLLVIFWAFSRRNSLIYPDLNIQFF